MNILTDQIIREATKHVGLKESEPNDGPEIRAWLARVGITAPSAWCVAFAWCMVDDACKAVGFENRLKRTASTRRLREWSCKYGYWTPEPYVGAIFLIDHGKGKGHAGIVREIRGNDIGTIEGNTNADGSREGTMVRIRTRRLGEISWGYVDTSLIIARQAG